MTYSLVYLSIYVHRSNRTYQSLLLQQQIRLLNSKIDPPEPEYEPPAYRLEQAGLEEQFKDTWNRTIESWVRKAQTTDWEAARIRWEDRIGNVFGAVRNSEKAQELEQRIQEKVIGVKDSAKAALKDDTTDALQGKRLLDEK